MAHDSHDCRLDDQVALVTAGANGIGEGIAMAVARQGADVAIADVDAANGERVAAAIRALGRKALFVPTDMTDCEQARAAVQRVAESFGRIDILANNAGGGRPVAFMEQSERSWRRHIELNFISMLTATQAAAAVMIAGQRGGTIVNIASSEALRAAPGYAVYAACKAGMVSFTRTMALELADHDIRVHALAPDTPGLRPYYAQASEAEVESRDRYIPMRRMGTMDEIGDVVAFLASGMASYLNGVTIPVDGGASASHGWTRAPGSRRWVLHHA
jgi:NAD(P)-dependent dehydrogenase (short-subunit alcohol dehydrogenase family)